MRILFVNKHEKSGGAAKIAELLFTNFWNDDHDCRYLVSVKESSNPYILTIGELENDKSIISEISGAIQRKFLNNNKNFLLKGKVNSLLWGLSHHVNLRNRLSGIEDFYFPNSIESIKKIINRFDIIHLHNLHDNYFNLPYLMELSHIKPTIVTLHDEWLFTGHCGYSIGCEKWITGCGKCPDLQIYPAIKKDRTKENWLAKKNIYQNSRLYITSPSNWLLDRARKSILNNSIKIASVIPNGVNQFVFKPKNKNNTRIELGFDSSIKVILFVANRVRSNPYKDFNFLLESLKLVQQKNPNINIVFICIGEKGEEIRIDNLTVSFLPFIFDETILAKYYQAADIYIHAAKSDNFPTTIIESLSCGTPVIATNVGGIKEQIIENKNGFLVQPKDINLMAEKILYILDREEILNSFSDSAYQSAKKDFSVETMIENYKVFYGEVFNHWSFDQN